MEAVGDRSYKEATPILFVGAVSDREKIGPQAFATPIAVGDRSYKEATSVLFVRAVGDRSYKATTSVIFVGAVSDREASAGASSKCRCQLKA